MGGRAGFSGVISLHHSDAVTDSHLSITSSRTLVGGVPITYKAARAFNKLNVCPRTTKDKLKMSSCLTKLVKKGRAGGDYGLLVGLRCSRKHTEMLLQQFQGQMTAGARGRDKKFTPSSFSLINDT